MDFPQFISFTVTNSCNLRCRMCGQWSEEGYVLNRTVDTRSHMRLEDWKRLVDEIAANRFSLKELSSCFSISMQRGSFFPSTPMARFWIGMQRISAG
jgi:sulfatase maturation enzyme AslB (radical SAM superfamily)